MNRGTVVAQNCVKAPFNPLAGESGMIARISEDYIDYMVAVNGVTGDPDVDIVAEVHFEASEDVNPAEAWQAFNNPVFDNDYAMWVRFYAWGHWTVIAEAEHCQTDNPTIAPHNAGLRALLILRKLTLLCGATVAQPTFINDD